MVVYEENLFQCGKNRVMKIIRFIFVLLVLLPITTEAQESQTTKPTENKHFQVSFESKLDPIVINTMHAWKICVVNNSNQPANNAEIKVDGGMPEHNHGLPTRPLVTQTLGEGCYLLEGMKFHMGGWWTVTLSITDSDIQDSVTFDLNL